jgi:hypothetical protein
MFMLIIQNQDAPHPVIPFDDGLGW